ncbi:uncharacterized protein LOC134710729 [Mytilus trossulus]|uniref:uncharacterized protein LOC134710729 n=1 Tax=Mytilus trossulus TaxID=6551 RepID=UPI0030044339
MACVELCQCCLRANEEEVAYQWCNDCNEAVCKNCGKAHRRFSSAHDVISIKDAPVGRKAVPKYCVSHENKKLILFCVEHDKLICHACLSESHRQCNSIVEIEKAAVGIKDSAAIKQLKEKMTTLKSILEKTQIENEQQLTTINIDKEAAIDHIEEFLQSFKDHLIQIDINLHMKYEKIVIQNKQNKEILTDLTQSLQEQADWLCMLESCSSESNIFHAVKHLDSIQESKEKQVNKIKNDLITIPLDVLPPEATKSIENFFQDFNQKTVSQTVHSITTSTSELKLPQINTDREIQPSPPRYQEFIPSNNCVFGAFCFTEDDRMFVEEFVLPGYESSLKYCLQVFDLQTNKSNTIVISDNFKWDYSGSVCMYDEKFVLLASMKAVMVIDTKLLKMCRTIKLEQSVVRGNLKGIKWISCKGGNIYVLVQSQHGLWLCSIDFNGCILHEVDLPHSLADIDFDGSKRFFYTDNRVNDIHCISINKSSTTSKCYSSLDLIAGCSILHISGDELLVLEKNTNTIYKLDIKNQRRSILKQTDDTENLTHFNLNLKLNKIAIMIGGGKRIRLLPF